MATQKNKAPMPEEEPKEKKTFPPNLYMAGNGTSWIVDFIYRGERYRETLGPVSRSIAKEMASQRRIAIAEGRLAVNGKKWINGEWVSAAPKVKILDPAFEAAMDDYLKWCKAHLRPRSYERTVTSSVALKRYFGNQRLSKISPFSIEAYKLDRRTGCFCANRGKPKLPSERCQACKHLLKPKSNATINRELAALKAMFNKALEWRFATESPMKGIKFFNEGRGRTRFLTPEEAKNLLAACNEDFRDVVLVALHSGCRKSEISTLTWPNVDLVQRTFTVLACYSKNGETKTLPMTDEVFAMLQRRKKERDKTPGDLVFVSRYNKPWKSWSTAWQNACERAGLKDFRFHDLRHCFGSWLAMNGTAPKAMMELMGHKTPAMTMRYSHLSVEYKRQAVAKLPKLGSLKTKDPQNPPHARKAKVVSFGKL